MEMVVDSARGLDSVHDEPREKRLSSIVAEEIFKRGVCRGEQKRKREGMGMPAMLVLWF